MCHYATLLFNKSAGYFFWRISTTKADTEALPPLRSRRTRAAVSSLSFRSGGINIGMRCSLSSFLFAMLAFYSTSVLMCKLNDSTLDETHSPHACKEEAQRTAAPGKDARSEVPGFRAAISVRALLP